MFPWLQLYNPVIIFVIQGVGAILVCQGNNKLMLKSVSGLNALES